MTSLNNSNNTSPDSIYNQKLEDILLRKQSIASDLNIFKKNQEDLLSNIKAVHVDLNDNYIKKVDTSTDNPSFNTLTKTFKITRNNNNKGGNFPRFKFKANNALKGSIFKKIRITFRWAGSEQSYNYHNLNNKEWCIGKESNLTICRSDSMYLPPKTGEYVTYTITITDQSTLNLNDLDWMVWLGPGMSSGLNYVTNPAIWEFKEIVFISDTSQLNINLTTDYNNIKDKINLLNNDILNLKGYDNKNKDKISEDWDKLISSSNDLNHSYNQLLQKYNDYNTNIGSTDSSIRLSKSKNLEYFGLILLIIVTVFIILKIMLSKEETGIENIILTLMIIIFIYYIYKWYADEARNKIIQYIPPFLYTWIPEGVRDLFNKLIDSINNKLLVFDYVR